MAKWSKKKWSPASDGSKTAASSAELAADVLKLANDNRLHDSQVSRRLREEPSGLFEPVYALTDLEKTILVSIRDVSAMPDPLPTLEQIKEGRAKLERLGYIMCEPNPFIEGAWQYFITELGRAALNEEKIT